MNAIEVYATSNGEITKRYYAELIKMGAIGEVAMNLFRAQKCSSRAKSYRKRSWKDEAYGRKTWSIGCLCECLLKHNSELKFNFGWKEDSAVLFDNDRSSFVFYLDLPSIGQISFHCRERGKGPDYSGEWDGMRGESEKRVIKFCNSVFDGSAITINRT